MKNLKRILSAAVACATLLSTLSVSAWAAASGVFSDEDQIVNRQAVTITSSQGLFTGYDDGTFGPDRVVTRAEAAVVIAKLLYGAQVDPSQHVMENKFDDVPDWANGYVCLAAADRIVEGYGNRTFGPNDPVTTVQFATMLLKSLGYYTNELDELDTQWKETVTHKANQLGLYGHLELEMDEGLRREDMAQMVFQTLFLRNVENIGELN